MKFWERLFAKRADPELVRERDEAVKRWEDLKGSYQAAIAKSFQMGKDSRTREIRLLHVRALRLERALLAPRSMQTLTNSLSDAMRELNRMAEQRARRSKKKLTIES